MRMTNTLLFVNQSRATEGFRVGASQAAKAASHDRILEIAAARIRGDGIDNLSVDELMKEAGLTHGGFYRHFDSREQLVAEAAHRALIQGSAWTIAAAQVGGERGFSLLVDGYLSPRHRDHPESGCGVAGATGVGRDQTGVERIYPEKDRGDEQDETEPAAADDETAGAEAATALQEVWGRSRL